jgi:ankyrin repeat protein
MNVIGGWGASNYDTSLICAAEGGHIEAMKLLKMWGASSSYNEALARAAAAGQLEAMKVLRTWGATDYRAAFYDAAASGCTSALNLLNEWYTSIHDYDTALAISAINGREDAIKFLGQLGASDYDRALVHAAAACRIKALKLLIELKNQKEMNRRDTY